MLIIYYLLLTNQGRVDNNLGPVADSLGDNQPLDLTRFAREGVVFILGQDIPPARTTDVENLSPNCHLSYDCIVIRRPKFMYFKSIHKI